MSDFTAANLKNAIEIRNTLDKYRDDMYIGMMYKFNIQCQDILKDDLGSRFVQSCGRDLAGEVVRNYFDASNFHLTVDQLAMRIWEFDYKNEYDPLRDNAQVHKDVYNYSEVVLSSTLMEIGRDMDESQKKLFEKERDESGKLRYTKEDAKIIESAKKDFAEKQKNEDGISKDTYTDKDGEYYLDKNGNKIRREQVEHTQALAAASYNEKYIKGTSIDELKKIYNSEDNFTMMLDTANQVKSDVRVCINGQGEIEYYNSQTLKDRIKNGENLVDITHRATPEQYADAVISTWEKTKGKTKEKLIKDGYLDQDGKVPKHIKNKLVQNIKRSQNAESMVILKNAELDAVGKDALGHTKKSLGKIIAGQIIYYAAPPLVFEIRGIIHKKPSSLENAIEALGEAGKRIGEYILSKLKTMFTNVAVNSLKNFIKVFMDILIKLVKATIKKILKLVKNLVLATVDAIKILVQKGSTGAQKADAVCNLFGVTITTFVIDVLFESLASGLHIPDFSLIPLQILATVVCTNLTMLILQKADLFDVRFGFKIQALRDLSEKSIATFNENVVAAESYAAAEIETIIAQAKNDCVQIYSNIMEKSPYEVTFRDDLNKINRMFDMKIDFDKEWLKFIGLEPLLVQN